MPADSSNTTRLPPNHNVEAEALQAWAISRHPATAPSVGEVSDILFLPGMAAGAWMWTDPWLHVFQDAGFTCWTMRFSGREGGSSLAHDPDALDRLMARALTDQNAAETALTDLARLLPGAPILDGPGLNDSSAEVEDALTRIGRPCIVVGYSLGGAVAQNVLRRARVRPARTILFNAVPPYGLLRASAQMFTTNPKLWQALLNFSFFGPGTVDPDLMRTELFPNGISETMFTRILANLSDESLAAILQTQGVPPFAPLPGPRRDLAVVGAARDVLVPAFDVHLTAMYYERMPFLLPDAGHAPMVEPGAAAAAMVLRDVALDLIGEAQRAA